MLIDISRNCLRVSMSFIILRTVVTQSRARLINLSANVLTFHGSSWSRTCEIKLIVAGIYVLNNWNYVMTQLNNDRFFKITSAKKITKFKTSIKNR